MMDVKPSKLIPGALAIGIYLVVLGLLVFYFNSRSEDKSKKYVKKDEHRIQVSLSSSAKSKKVTKKKEKAKAIKKVQKKSTPKPKKTTKKRVIKEKIVKKKAVKKKVLKKPKPKKNNTKDLFANVKAPKKKNIIKVSDKPVKSKPKKNLIKMTDKPKSATSRINNSLKDQKSKETGVESAYLAKVQSLLEGWPAQSDYAGEKVKVILYISPSGFFDFKIKSASRNEDFNRGLTEYLEQLQEFGFGRHKGGRVYNFEAEFIAKG